MKAVPDLTVLEEVRSGGGRLGETQKLRRLLAGKNKPQSRFQRRFHFLSRYLKKEKGWTSPASPTILRCIAVDTYLPC